MTSENILSGLCDLEDALTSVAGVQIDWDSEAKSHKQYSFQLCQLSGEFAIRGFSP